MLHALGRFFVASTKGSKFLCFTVSIESVWSSLFVRMAVSVSASFTYVMLLGFSPLTVIVPLGWGLDFPLYACFTRLTVTSFCDSFRNINGVYSFFKGITMRVLLIRNGVFHLSQLGTRFVRSIQILVSLMAGRSIVYMRVMGRVIARFVASSRVCCITSYGRCLIASFLGAPMLFRGNATRL